MGQNRKSTNKDVGENILSFLAEIAETMPGNFYWKNRESEYLGCNTALLEATGPISRNDLVGKTDYDLWGPQADSLRANDQYVMQTGRMLRTEESVTLADGTQMYFAVIKVPLKDESDNIIGIIGNSLDITETKNLQLRLSQAQAELKVSNNFKSTLLTSLDQTIRSPLTTISASCELMRRLTDEEGILDYISDIQKSLLSITSFLDTIPLLIQLETYPDKELYKEQASLKECLQLSVEENQYLAAEQGTKIKLNYKDSCPEDFVAPFQLLREVFGTLIYNACRFTLDGKVFVSCEMTAQNDSTCTLRVSVADTGPGVSSEIENNLFGMFDFSKRAVSYNSVASSGVRLSIVKRILESINGKISMNSRRDEGAEFIIEITLEKIAPISREPWSENEGSGAEINEEEAFSLKKRINVLLVEDDAMNLKVFKDFLDAIASDYNSQFCVDVAQSGKQAKPLLGKHYDIVFSDIYLPDMMGTELIQKIHQLHGEHAPPIIAMTVGIARDVEEQLASKVIQILQKPIPYEVVEKALLAYCGVN